MRWEVDLPLIAASGLAGLTPELFKGELSPPYCGLACDRANLNPLDRAVVGNRSVVARHLSDGLVSTSIALPYVLDTVDVLVSGQRGLGWLKDVTVLTEVLVVNFALNNVVKFAVSRPRPLVYDAGYAEEERLDPDAALSFYSGHSSTAFAMATAYSYLFMQRHPRSPLVVPVWIVTEGIAATTAALRVVAGKHFWTDVIAGAGVGASLGLLVPILHRHAVVPVESGALRGMHLSLLPTAYPGGGGLSVSLQ